MITWNNLDTLESFKELSKVGRVDIKEAMSGDNGAKRVKEYNIPMAEGFTYNFAAKQVDADVLEALAKLAKEAQLTEKFEALYNGAVINTGENRLVLHQLTRGQLGDAVVADGVDKRKFYVEQQERIAEFANKVHSGEITNAAGEKFTTVVQIGIGGSDLGPRAMYLALENWAGERLAASYVNFYITNGGVLIPQFGDVMDEPALKAIGSLFEGRKVYPIYARDIIVGGGNIHCITQQIPQ